MPSLSDTQRAGDGEEKSSVRSLAPSAFLYRGIGIDGRSNGGYFSIAVMAASAGSDSVSFHARTV